MSPVIGFVVGLFRSGVALLFLVSGLIKLNDPKGFLYKIEEYIEVFHALVPALGLRAALLPLAPAAAVSIAVVEVAVAVLLALGLWRALTTGLLLAMIGFFTLLTGYSAITGAVTDCGCFGEVLQLTPTQSFVKDIVLLVMICVLTLWRERIRPLLPGWRGFALAGIGIAAALALVGYAWTRLPAVDFSAFAIGKSIPQGIDTRKASGERMIKDYIPLAAKCGYNEFQGRVLWVVVNDLALVTAAERAHIGTLAADSSLRVALLTASGAAARAEFAAQLGPAGRRLCLAAQDLTLVKTIVRSSPGYLLLENGVVIGKWPRSDAPLAAALKP